MTGGMAAPKVCIHVSHAGGENLENLRPANKYVHQGPLLIEDYRSKEAEIGLPGDPNINLQR